MCIHHFPDRMVITGPQEGSFRNSIYPYLHVNGSSASISQLGQLRQLPGVGDQMCVRLGASQIITLLDVAKVSPAKVDTVANRKHPYGHGELFHSSCIGRWVRAVMWDSLLIVPRTFEFLPLISA